jgi:WD40 repeat protein
MSARRALLGLTIVFLAHLVVFAAEHSPSDEQQQPRTDGEGNSLPTGAILRLGSMRLRHPGGVRCLAFSPDRKQLASGGGDDVVRLWDVDRGQLAFALTGHRDTVQAVAFSRDGKRLASVSADGEARLWDVVKLQLVQAFKGRPSLASLVTVGLSPDGRVLAVGNNFSLRLWDVESGKSHGELIGAVSALAFSADGKQLAASLLPRGKIYIQDVESGKWKAPFDGPRGCCALTFSADGTRLLAGSSGTSGSAVTAWSTDKGTRLEQRPLEGDDTHFSIFGALALSPEGGNVATAGGDLPLTVWDTTTGRKHFQAPLTSDEYCLAFSASGALLATGSQGGVIRLWDTASGKEIHPRLEPEGFIHALAFTPDGTHLFTGGGDRFLTCWRLDTGRAVARLVGHRNPVQFLGVSPDGKTLYSAGGWKESPTRFRMWDARSHEEIGQVTSQGNDVTFAAGQSGDGKILAAAVYSKLLLWDALSGNGMTSIKADAAIRAVAFAPDGRTVAIVEGGNLLRFWHVPTRQEIPPDVPPQAAPVATHPAFSPNGRLVAAYSPQLRAIHLFEASTGERIGAVLRDIDQVQQIAFSPDGRALAVSTGQRLLRVWQIDTTSELYQFDAGEATGPIAFSPDGKRLASAQAANVLVWDVAGRTDKYRPREAVNETKMDRLWETLKSRDASRGTEAVWDLMAAAPKAVPYLAVQLRPRQTPGPDQIRKWMKELQDEKFTVRERAHTELAKLEEIAEPYLKKALAEDPPLELRRRAEQLLRELSSLRPNPERLQVVRAMEALELIGTPEARAVLERMAGGAPGAEITLFAQRAIERLRKYRP